MKVLVTGANGFVGSWLVRELARREHDVRILARKSSDLSELEGARYETAFGDVTDPASLENALRGCDSVFHLAGVVGYSKAQRPLMEKVNVDGTRNLLAAIEKNPIKRLVHMSSVVAIGASFDGRYPLNENSEFNLGDLDLGYFETKRKAEILVKSAVEDGRVDAVILNPSTIYGPGDAKKGSRKVQVKVARGKFPFYTSGGVNVIAVEDVIEGLLAGWEKGVRGERYILAGENITIKTLFHWIASAAGVKPPGIYLPNGLLHLLGKFGDRRERQGAHGPVNSENAWTSTLFHWFDNSKARRALGLNPRSSQEAVNRSVEWMQQQGLLKP
jgi:dihydroflavonol-4-reductase